MIAMSAAAVTARLRAQANAVDLHAGRRMDAKVDMSAAAVTRRLQEVSALREACLRWVRVGEANGLGRKTRDGAARGESGR